MNLNYVIGDSVIKLQSNKWETNVFWLKIIYGNDGQLQVLMERWNLTIC